MTLPTAHNPKVTIITTAYNQAHCIENSIRGALAQDYPNLEVIVADDASTDNIAEVIARYKLEPRFRYIRHPQNLGIFANYRQTLVEHATGEWAMIVDGDDYLIDPQFISKSMESVRARKKVVLIFGGCRLLGSDGRFRDYRPTQRTWEQMDGFAYFQRWGVYLGVPHQAALYRRDLALKLDFYRCSIISGDWESLRRLILQGDVLLHGPPVVVWYLHMTSNSHKVNTDERIADLQNIIRPYEYGIELGLDKVKLDRWKRETLALYLQNNFKMCLRAGRLDCARALSSYIRQYDESVYRLCLRKMATNPRLLILAMLYGIGGSPLVNGMETLWRRLTLPKMAYGVRETSL